MEDAYKRCSIPCAICIHGAEKGFWCRLKEEHASPDDTCDDAEVEFENDSDWDSFYL